jgi:hypothetical protein
VITERLELLRELVPGLHRLAVIVRNDPGLDQKLQDIRSEARRKRIEPLMLEATTGKALELAFARLRGDLCEAIMWPPARLVQPSGPGSSRLPRKLDCR